MFCSLIIVVLVVFILPDVATSGDTRGPAACEHSCTLVFEPGALRDESWGGFVWVYLSHSGIVPKVFGPQGVQLATVVTAIKMPEPLHSNNGGGNNSKGMHNTLPAATATTKNVLGTVWKIAVCRGHNPVADMDDTMLIYW